MTALFSMLELPFLTAHFVRMTSVCKRCQEAPTINAHILPKAAIRAIRERGTDTKTLAVRFNGAFPINTPNGLSDSRILCASCDGKIGQADKWFMETLDSLHISAEGVKPYAIVDTSLDARRAIQFAVSIIYRASLSKSNHFSNIALGPYTKPAADISLGAGDADLNAVLVLINVLTSPDLNTKQFAFYPVRCAGDNGPYFIYVISGIQFVVKFGGKFKTLTSNDTYSDHLKIDPDKTVSVCCFPFNESAEADWLKNVARRH